MGRIKKGLQYKAKHHSNTYTVITKVNKMPWKSAGGKIGH